MKRNTTGRKFLRLLTLLLIMAGSIVHNDELNSNAFARSHRDTVAERIAEVVTNNWGTYGRLPSVAIGQAFVESGLGVGGNMFGVIGHRGRGVEFATIGYLQCLNNQYFRGEGAFSLSPEYQLSVIMKGGRYCAGQYPGGSYYRNVINSIDRYNWRRFDKEIIKKIKAKKAKKLRKKRQKRPFKIIFDESLPEGTAIADPTYIKKGSTIIFQGGIVETVSTKRGLKNTIICGCKGTIFPQAMDGLDFFDLSKLKIDLSVYEDSKG